jgi:hypothetical protein
VLVTSSGQCQALRYLKQHRETAPRVLARIRQIDLNGPLSNPELFRWLDGHRHKGLRLCEYKVHSPRACRAFAFLSGRGFVIVRIEDKTTSDERFNDTMSRVKASIDEFIRDGERYE